MKSVSIDIILSNIIDEFNKYPVIPIETKNKDDFLKACKILFENGFKMASCSCETVPGVFNEHGIRSETINHWYLAILVKPEISIGYNNKREITIDLSLIRQIKAILKE